jgi:thiol:disulfide interchange protein DsbD
MYFAYRRWLISVAILLAFALPLLAQIQKGETLVKATLIADTAAVVPGKDFQVGLLLEMAPDWHTYWEYSGDAGFPTRVQWTLPEGFRAGPIQWPAPEAKLESSDIQTYAYGNRVLLLTKITPSAIVSGSVTIRAKASWLACKDICIPGGAEVQLVLPVGSSTSPDNVAIFEEYRRQIPVATAPPFTLTWQRKEKILQLKVGGLPPATAMALYPLPRLDQAVGHPKSVSPDTMELSVEGGFRGVLAVGEGALRRSWVVEELPSSGAIEKAAVAPMGLWLALFYGFLGGMILNLMPCVLPVISLKIFGFIQQSGESRWRILSHGVAFIGGIFAWFLGLAAVIVALKSGGSEVTWAFQFQNPWFNIVMGTVVFVFALNLAGVFEFLLPGRTATALEAAGSKGGHAGSFFQGVFATLLATPCTAPFLGSALGFAFSQSPAVIVAMFASVAAGMALPYLLLTAQPGWMKFLPRPGIWMERLKQFMAFPLFATLLWIFSILGGQRGLDGMIAFAGFLLCLGLACWVYGAFCGPVGRHRFLALSIIATLCIGGGWYFLGQKFAHAGKKDANGIDWVPFSQARLQAELAAGRSVFLDFTADWCITCKFNERTAIDTALVRALFDSKKVVPMKADWTNANPEITAALQSFGRVGVPFYVIYPSGNGNTPVVLPELLTESILADALNRLP